MVILYLQHPIGAMVGKSNLLINVLSKNGVSENFKEKFRLLIPVTRAQEIHTGYYFSFKQLMEIAIKAISPGINGPGTATISFRALGDLLDTGWFIFSNALFYR